MKVSIIIPVFNEYSTIDLIIQKIKKVKLPENMQKEIIIVNDGSTDNTAEILEQYKIDPEIKIFHKKNNAGKSSAIRLGIEETTGDIVLIQDADLEYSPEDYPQLIEPIIKGNASIVYGSRFKGNIKKMPLVNRIANIVANITLNILYNAKITDFHTCYKVFRKDLLKSIKTTSRNFHFDTEITVKLLKSGHKIIEVPISYSARTRKDGKKITWFDAISTFFHMIYYKFHN